MASVFNDDDDVSACVHCYVFLVQNIKEKCAQVNLTPLAVQSEPEEMPPEAKMRMKNIGRYGQGAHISSVITLSSVFS